MYARDLCLFHLKDKRPVLGNARTIDAKPTKERAYYKYTYFPALHHLGSGDERSCDVPTPALVLLRYHLYLLPR